MDDQDPQPTRPRTSGGLRGTVERHSAPALLLLHERRTVFLIAVLVLVGVGLFTPNLIGVAALVPVMAVLAWLTYLNWPTLEGGARFGRMVGFVLLAAFAVSHAFGWF